MIFGLFCEVNDWLYVGVFDRLGLIWCGNCGVGVIWGWYLI